MILSHREIGCTSERTSFCQLCFINTSLFCKSFVWPKSGVFHALNQCFCAAELYKGRVSFEIKLCNLILKCS